MIWLLVVLAVWLVVVGHGLVQLRGWIESAQADIELQRAHRTRLVQQSANATGGDAIEPALARAEQALAGARRYYNALVIEYNRRLAIPPGPLVGCVARLAKWPISETISGSHSEKVSETVGGRNVLRWNT